MRHIRVIFARLTRLALVDLFSGSAAWLGPPITLVGGLIVLAAIAFVDRIRVRRRMRRGGPAA